MANNNPISDELLAAYLDGNTNEEETCRVLQALQSDEVLRETLDIATSIEEEDSSLFTLHSSLPTPHSSLFTLHSSLPNLPMLQMAAQSGENICAVLCEIFILHRRGIPYDQENLLSEARQKGWLKPEGTPLYCLGNLLAFSGLLVSRRYDATLADIQRDLEKDNDIVVGVDREKLYAEETDLEDTPNHAVVVTAINTDAVTIYDPLDNSQLQIPNSQFELAWKESFHYMIQILQSVDEYEPHPVNVDNIPLDGDLEELQEAIAENAHDVWAKARIREGWTYGTERDDIKKQHPDLIPYTALPDSEKEYDRIMAFNTIKLVKKLGFDIVKRK